MANKDFDDLMKIFRASHSRSGTTIVSTEVDLELARGFIAKIKKIIFKIDKIGLLPVSDNVAHDESVLMALIRDPDDTTTIEIPSGVVQHDVIGEFKWDYADSLGTINKLLAMSAETYKIIDFDQVNFDVITARNMRFNSISQNAGSGPNNEPNVQCEIHYTLEKVSDADILNILDIL